MRKPTEVHTLFPYDSEDQKDHPVLDSLLAQIHDHVLNRADGVQVRIWRSSQFPKQHGKRLIRRVEIETWECVA